MLFTFVTSQIHIIYIKYINKTCICTPNQRLIEYLSEYKKNEAIDSRQLEKGGVLF